MSNMDVSHVHGKQHVFDGCPTYNHAEYLPKGL